jgi:death on curing protein
VNTRYLTVDDIRQINAAVLENPNLLRDLGLLESAVLRPQTTVGGADAYPGVVDKAAALFHSLTLNHAFVDGNKRTAVVALVIFLEMNGHRVHASDVELVHLAVDTAEGRLDVDALAGRLKELAIEGL